MNLSLLSSFTGSTNAFSVITVISILLQFDLVLAGGTSISCVPLKYCAFTKNLLDKRPFDPLTQRFLHFTHCGYENGDIKVWCNIFHYCVTPEGNNGTCTTVKNCPSFLKLLYKFRTNLNKSSVKDFLRSFRCSSVEDPEIRVCCSNEKLDIPYLDPDEEVGERFGDSLPNPHLGQCGTQDDDDNKIVGGKESGLAEFPWMALLKYYNKGKYQFACAGSLINEKNVITAAHCVDSYITRVKGLGKIYSVVLGEYDVRNETDCIYHKYGVYCADPPQEIFIESIKMHPEYSSGLIRDDIAIIHLQRVVKYSDYIRPICLPSKNFKLKGNETFQLSGWGRTEEEKLSPVKLKTTVGLNKSEACNKLRETNLTSKQLCVGAGDGKDNCFGDSGAPLMLEKRVENNFVTFATGIVSLGFGFDCGQFPSVYTFVPPYVDWIKENIKH